MRVWGRGPWEGTLLKQGMWPQGLPGAGCQVRGPFPGSQALINLRWAIPTLQMGKSRSGRPAHFLQATYWGKRQDLGFGPQSTLHSPGVLESGKQA